MRSSTPCVSSLVSDRTFARWPTRRRRAILNLLREHPSLTAGEIAARFPSISRPAVSKHLGIPAGSSSSVPSSAAASTTTGSTPDRSASSSVTGWTGSRRTGNAASSG